MKKPIFIAEVKPENKSAFSFEKSQLTDLAIDYGDWISIHTDARFGGSFDDIAITRKKTDKPILAKGYHAHNDDVQKAIDLGADYVLVVDRFISDPIRNKKILFEISSFAQVLKMKERWREEFLNEIKFVYNGRNLQTGLGKKYIGDYSSYRSHFKWLCGASLIRTPADVDTFYPNCDAFIIGKNLKSFISEQNKNRYE